MDTESLFDDELARAVLSVDEAARVLFNEGARARDVVMQQLAARILGFTTEWLAALGLD